MENDKGLESLQIWQQSVYLAVRIHKTIVPLLPEDEKWGMANQMRRAAQSIPANIAEGYGRFYYQEGIRFCYLARGSLEELKSHLSLALKLEYLKPDDVKPLLEEMSGLHRMINGYIAFLKRGKRGENEPGSDRALRELQTDYRIELEINSPDT